MMKLLDTFLEKLAESAQTDEREIAILQQHIQAERKIVYVLRRESILERMLLERILKRKGLSSSITILPLRGRSGSEFTLTTTKRFRRKLLEKLDHTIRESEQQEVVLVPISFFAGRGPSPWPSQIPWGTDFPFLPLGEIWRAFIFKLYQTAFRCEFGAPVAVTPDMKAPPLLRELSLALYRLEKTARGAPSQAPETVEGIVLSGGEFEEILREMSAETGLSRGELLFRAQNIFRQTAASMRRWAIAIMYRLLKRVVPRLFKLEVRGIEQLREEIARHPVILLPAHRSHFDYLAISYALFHADLPLPFIAAGDNLNFFPAGSVLRASGGFFIRRKADGDRLYRVILERYLTALVKHGDLIEFYIEGGRSRTGLTLSPKFGLLKYLVLCFHEGERADLRFIPVGVSYERVPELKSLLAENLGQKKRRENSLALLKFRRKLKRHAGELVISFGSPLSLKELSLLPRTKPERQGLKERLLTEDLGFAIVRGIQRELVLTKRALVSMGMMMATTGEEKMVATCLGDALRVLGTSNGALTFSKLNSLTVWRDQPERTTIEPLLNNGLTEALSTGTLGSALEAIVQEIIISISGEENAEEEVDLTLAAQETLYHALHGSHLFFTPILLALSGFSSSPADALFFFHQTFKPLLLLEHWNEWSQEATRLAKIFRDCGWIDIRSDGGPLVVEITKEGHEPLGGICRIFLPFLTGLHIGSQLCFTGRWNRGSGEEFENAFDAMTQILVLAPQERELMKTKSIRSFVFDYVIRGGRAIWSNDEGPAREAAIIESVLKSLPR